jgi:alanyl-tRNA synthetase
VIASEEAIAKGIRRIVALTGPEADRSLHRAQRLEKELTDLRTVVEQGQSNGGGDGLKLVQKQLKDFVNVNTFIYSR